MKLLIQKCFKNFSNNVKLTLSHVKGIQDGKMIYKSIPQIFRQITQQFPNNYALHSYDQNISFTYKQFYDRASQLAAGFIEYGLKPKDRIGIYSYNNHEWYTVQLAAALADLILVNINPAYQSEQLAYTLKKVQCKVLITSSQFKSSNYLDILNQLIPELKQSNSSQVKSKRFPDLKKIIKIDNLKTNGMDNLKNFFLDKKISFPQSRPEDPANIQFTSGTTGSPKACVLSHINILNNGYSIGINCKYTQKDIICIPVPLYHCFGMILGNLAALTRGATSVFTGEGFDAAKALAAVSKYKCTSIYGVPTMFIEYFKQYQKNPEKYDLKTLRTGIMAGALCPEVVMKRVIKQFNMHQITICYGMTQTSPVSFQTHPDDTLQQKTKTVGRILPRLEAKIVDDNNVIVPINTPGQIIVKGESVMLGYWQDQINTKKSIIDGYMRSGDLGTMDQDGFVNIVGRKKDMIIRGGENIYPKQIEDYLRLIPNVIDVQVIGFPDEKYGEQVFALIKLKQGTTLTNSQIYEHCHKKIAHYKVPKYAKIVSSFPITVSGKPQKYKMKQQLVEQQKKNKDFHKNYRVKTH